MITVLFAYSIDFKDVIQKLDPQQIVQSINATVNVFDQCAEHFDVFKVETKADASYMVVAGIQDRSVQPQRRESSSVKLHLIRMTKKKTNRFFMFSFLDRVNPQLIVFLLPMILKRK